MGKSKLLVIGSSSLVGSHFVETFGIKHEISAAGRRNIFENGALALFIKVDILEHEKLADVIRTSKADYVLNYAAETNVDGCERQRGDFQGSAYQTNTEAVSSMASACKKAGKRFCHISTDFVFDGTSGPYSEDDAAGPINTRIGWYGYTKFLAEKKIQETMQSDFCIIRIGYPFRAQFQYKTDFARNILDLHGSGRLYPMFSDQLMSPTLIDDISAATDHLIQKSSEGIYHVACQHPTTPYDFASNLLLTFFPDEDVSSLKKGSILDFNAKTGHAPRPVKGGLKVDKITSSGFVPRTFEDAIDQIFKQRKKVE